jgi:hypothetical protein
MSIILVFSSYIRFAIKELKLSEFDVDPKDINKGTDEISKEVKIYKEVRNRLQNFTCSYPIPILLNITSLSSKETISIL